MLGQRLDRRQRLQRLRARPVISELLGMEACPRPDKPQRTRWKRSIENSQRGKLYLGRLITVLGVEVRRRMVGAVHPYDDPVERRQARHRAIVCYSAADLTDSPSAEVTSLGGRVEMRFPCGSTSAATFLAKQVQDQQSQVVRLRRGRYWRA